MSFTLLMTALISESAALTLNEEKHVLDLRMLTFVGSVQPGLSCLTSWQRLMENCEILWAMHTDLRAAWWTWPHPDVSPLRCKMQPDLLPEFLKVQGLYDRCLSVCPDLWSSSCFLPALTAKNQRYEITACFVKNSDWTEERKPEVLSLIGCSLYLFCLSFCLARQPTNSSKLL